MQAVEPVAPSKTPVEVHWTPRRVRATAVHACAGFLIGGILTGVLAVVMFLGLMILGGPKGFDNPSNILLVCVPLAGLAWLILRSGAEGSCRKHPAGPLGIAIGLGVGNLVPLGYGIAYSSAAVVVLSIILAAAQAYGGYLGGKRGLTHRFSLTAVEGIGILCAHCGYDLSSTQSHWPCPECGGRMRHAGRDVE